MGGNVLGIGGGVLNRVLSLRVIREICTTTSHDGLGGRTIPNVFYSCEGRGWSKSVGGVIGESGSGAKFAALTARLRCQGWELSVKPIKEVQIKKQMLYTMGYPARSPSKSTDLKR